MLESQQNSTDFKIVSKRDCLCVLLLRRSLLFGSGSGLFLGSGSGLFLGCCLGGRGLGYTARFGLGENGLLLLLGDGLSSIRRVGT